MPFPLPIAGIAGSGSGMMIQQPSILITDDDVDFRETLQDVLVPQGYRTLLAGDGEEALHIIERQPVHLLLMDMHMPKLTGLETFRRMRQMRALLPCILMSAAADENLVREARSMRIFRVLSKPMSRRQITVTVQLALRRTYNLRPGDLNLGDEPTK